MRNDRNDRNDNKSQLQISSQMQREYLVSKILKIPDNQQSAALLEYCFKSFTSHNTLLLLYYLPFSPLINRILLRQDMAKAENIHKLSFYVYFLKNNIRFPKLSAQLCAQEQKPISSLGDLEIYLNLFEQFQKLPEKQRQFWCQKNYLSHKYFKQLNNSYNNNRKTITNIMCFLDELNNSLLQSNRSIEEDIAQMIFYQNNHNLAIYNGQTNLGYTLIQNYEQILISQDSYLSTEEIKSLWIFPLKMFIYSEQNRQEAIIIIPVNVQWLKNCPRIIQMLEQMGLKNDFQVNPFVKNIQVSNLSNKVMGNSKKLLNKIEDQMASFNLKTYQIEFISQNSIKITIIQPKITEKLLTNLENQIYAEISLLRQEIQSKNIQTFKRITTLIDIKIKDGGITESLKYRSPKEYWYKESLDKKYKVKLQLKWFEGVSQKAGYIRFYNEWDVDAAENYFEENKLDGKYIKTRRSKKHKYNLNILNLSYKTDDIWLRKFLKYMPEAQDDIDYVVIFREEEYSYSDPYPEEIMSQPTAKDIKNFFKQFSQYPEAIKVDMNWRQGRKYQDQFKKSCLVCLNDPLLTKKLQEKFDCSLEILGSQRMYTKIFIHYQYCFLKGKYKIIKSMLIQEIDKLIRKTRQLIKVKFPQREQENENVCRIGFECHSFKVLNKIQQFMSKALQGYRLKLEKTEFIEAFLDEITNNFKVLRAQFNVYLEISNNQKELLLFGKMKNIKLIEQELLKQYKEIQNQIHDTVRANIYFENKNISKILKNDYEILKIFQQKCQDFSFRVSFENRVISLKGSEKTLKEVKQLILQSFKEIDYKNKENNCQICWDQIKTPYILFYCKHKFCEICLQNHVLQSIESQDLPIRCPACQHALHIGDIDLLLTQEKFDETRNKIAQISFKKFIGEHQKEYKPCLQIDCEHYFPSGEKEALCPLCLTHQCLECKVHYHEGISCKQAQANKNEDKSFELMVEQTNNMKKCPNCSQVIQKRSGCNKMICQCCQIIFCWKCLKQFTDKQECYKHLNVVHGGFYDEEE